MKRDDARRHILNAANRNRVSADPFTIRHIHQAVARVRNRGKVAPWLLVDAGFKAHGPNYRPGRST